LVPVKPGARYVAFCGLIPWAVDGYVVLNWSDSADLSKAPIWQTGSNVIPGKAGDGASDWRPDDLSDYQSAFIFDYAPLTARYARVVLVAGGTWTASDVYGAKYLWAAQPFIGEVPITATSLPPWDSGGSPVVGTPGIAPGAATDIDSGDRVGVTFSSPGPQWIDVQLFEIGASVAGVFEITATFEVTGSGTGGGGGGENRIYVGLFETTKAPALISREALTASANETRRATVTLPATIEVNAGDTIRPILRVSRSRYGIVGGVTVGNSTDSVGAISWRATLIKR
jgi:hypothetical protein